MKLNEKPSYSREIHEEAKKVLEDFEISQFEDNWTI